MASLVLHFTSCVIHSLEVSEIAAVPCDLLISLDSHSEDEHRKATGITVAGIFCNR